jgi:hypothetical protein
MQTAVRTDRSFGTAPTDPTHPGAIRAASASGGPKSTSGARTAKNHANSCRRRDVFLLLPDYGPAASECVLFTATCEMPGPWSFVQ